MAKLMRSVPEILILVKGMVAATRSVASTLCLLIIFMYIFAIVFTQQVGKIAGFEEPFGSMSMSMFTLLLSGTLLDDCTAMIHPMIVHGMYFEIVLMLIYILLSAFTVLNMLIGVLCEVVSETAEVEREKATIQKVKEEIQGVMDEIDTSGDGLVSSSEFEEMMKDDTVLKALDDIGIRPDNLPALGDILFEPDDPPADGEPVELPFDDFLKVIVHHRPEKEASVMDVAEVRKMMRKSLRATEDKVQSLSKAIDLVACNAVPDAHLDAMRKLIEKTNEMRDKTDAETIRAEKATAEAHELEQELARLKAKPTLVS